MKKTILFVLAFMFITINCKISYASEPYPYFERMMEREMASTDLYEGLTRGKAAGIMVDTGKFGNDGDVVNPFCDISHVNYDKFETQYYYDILALYKIYLFSGIKGSDGKIYAYPDQYLSREQAACMVAKAFSLEYKGTEITEPKDINSVSEYAKASVMTCLENKIIGLKDNNFCPKEPITKYEFIQMLKTILFELKPDFKFDRKNIETIFNDRGLSKDIHMYISDLRNGYVKKNYHFTIVIENHSNQDYSYGGDFELEMLVEKKWVHVPLSMDVDGVGYKLRGGGGTGETTMRLSNYSEHLEDGRYRIIKTFDTYRNSPFENYTTVYSTCEFDLH